MKVKPMSMLSMMLAGWVNRHQQDVITYLKGGFTSPGWPAIMFQQNCTLCGGS